MIGGDNLPSLVGIGLNDLPNIGVPASLKGISIASLSEARRSSTRQKLLIFLHLSYR